MNMTFILSSEVKKYILSGEATNEIYISFHFTRSNKSYIHDKNLNFLFIIYKLKSLALLGIGV